jgi:hypothetical protein
MSEASSKGFSPYLIFPAQKLILKEQVTLFGAFCAYRKFKERL